MNEQPAVVVKWQSVPHKRALQHSVERDRHERVAVRSFCGNLVSMTRLESSALTHFAMIPSRARTRQWRIWPLQNSTGSSHAGRPDGLG